MGMESYDEKVGVLQLYPDYLYRLEGIWRGKEREGICRLRGDYNSLFIKRLNGNSYQERLVNQAWST
jgi:hypothetical protein